MKKIISSFLAVIMLLSVLSLTAFAAGEPSGDTPPQSGTDVVPQPPISEGQKVLNKLKSVDFDKDGNYSTLDAAEVLKAAAGIVDDKGNAYDVNGDDVVSIADAQKMLRIAAGIESVATKEELLILFNEKMNGIKAKETAERPDFSKTSTAICPSTKVTVTGAPLRWMNVTNMEYKDYIPYMLHPFRGGALVPKEEQEKLKQSAVELYKPHTTRKNILGTSNSFNHEYPIYGLTWVSKLTANDIASINCKYIDGDFIFQIKMGQYTYTGAEYPLGASNFARRQDLPYGRIFTLPNFDDSDGSKLNKMVFKNGSVTLTLNSLTEKPAFANYVYTAIADVSAPPQDGMQMRMNTTTNLEEIFEFTY